MGAVEIPVERYTSPEFFARELELLWPRAWQLACTVDHVAEPGDFYEYQVGPYSVLVVRGDDGALRAFQNACRHRGSAICQGAGSGLTELRCPFHRWAWDLRGRLREIPSRRVFGVTNDELPLLGAQVGTWGPLVFVNLDPGSEPLEDFLAPVPADCAWARVDEFRCTAVVSVPARCNWKTLIDGFSETYHVQGLHPEMLAMCDDVNGPQQVWRRHGKLEQPYGVPSPRLGGHPGDQAVWEAFVRVMGNRVGADMTDPGPVPAVPEGGDLRTVLADLVRDQARSRGVELPSLTVDQTLNMQQYNLFPNVTILVFADMLQVVRSRPGATHLESWMDAMSFERGPAGHPAPRSRPFDLVLDSDGELPLGLVLNQDLANFARSQKGLHQPGLTHLVVSPTEECRIVNLHRNLEAYLGIVPSELRGATDRLPSP
jgi:phenylpropionate dioxygenase-like ring-hydroxylating dioxygenase large terminal subunit